VNLVVTPSDPTWPADTAAFLQKNRLGFPTAVDTPYVADQ
jgi:hypothetical protein